MIWLRIACPLFTAISLLAPLSSAQDRSRIDAGFEKFWAAPSRAEAASAAAELLKSGVTFEDAWRRLKAGRTYVAQSSGVVQMSNRTADGVEHYFAVNVPPGYDPARRYQLRFQLHGGIGARTDNKPRGTGEIGALAGAEQFTCSPMPGRMRPGGATTRCSTSPLSSMPSSAPTTSTRTASK